MEDSHPTAEACAAVPTAVAERAAATYRRAYSETYAALKAGPPERLTSPNDEATVAGVRAVVALTQARPTVAPVGETRTEPRVVDNGGKQYYIQGPGWVMQPVGEVSADEARRICELSLHGGILGPQYLDQPDPSHDRTFCDTVRRIADDFHPDRDADAPLALGEMRDALSTALEERGRAELCRDEGCCHAGTDHVCLDRPAALTATPTQPGRTVGEDEVLQSENAELRSYLRAFVKAAIDPDRPDLSEFLANPFMTYEFSFIEEDEVLDGTRVVTGGQIRRAAELVGHDALRVVAPESTIARELTEARDLRLEVVTLREKLAASDGALQALLRVRSTHPAPTPEDILRVALHDVDRLLEDDRYYVLSYKHTRGGEVCWWRPDCCGYVRSLVGAGIYTMTQAYRATDPDALDSDRSFPVPVTVVRALSVGLQDQDRVPTTLLPALEDVARAVLTAHKESKDTEETRSDAQ